MNNLLKILNLISSRNVEVTVTYEAASDGYIFRITKMDVPIKTTVCFTTSRECLDHAVEGEDLLYFLVKENIDKLDKLSDELHRIK